MKRRQFLLGASSLALGGCALDGCSARATERVVVYCSVDDVYARPIMSDISQRTGLKVDALYDTEAAKTAGLANRIRAEKLRPRGDVFWSSALLQTLLLESENLLQPYVSPSAKQLPPALKSARGMWTAVGVRRHVIVAHEKLKTPPRRLEELVRLDLKDKIGISNPQFGTSGDFVAALGVRWGREKTLAYFRDLKRNGVQVLAGNSVVAQRVAQGDLLAGITDSDDFFATHAQFPALRLVDSALPAFINAMPIPGSAAILRDAPNVAQARKFLDALLELRTERQLAAVMRGVIAPRALDKPFEAPDDTAKWVQAWQQLRDPLAEILL